MTEIVMLDSEAVTHIVIARRLRQRTRTSAGPGEGDADVQALALDLLDGLSCALRAFFRDCAIAEFKSQVCRPICWQMEEDRQSCTEPTASTSGCWVHCSTRQTISSSR
jgi:hypothetical protein